MCLRAAAKGWLANPHPTFGELTTMLMMDRR